MSRRSLRLDDGLLDRSLPLSSASFSVGGASWRSSRSVRSRRSQQFSSSCSESLLLSTPCKQTASDASLLSSLLETSSIQETSCIQDGSMGHSFWGLDHDVDPRESTILADRTLIGSDPRQSAPSRVYCRDCELPSDRKEPASCPAPSSCHASSSFSSSPSEPASPETTVIYSRNRSHRSRPGVLASLWSRWAGGVTSLLALMLPKYNNVTGEDCREKQRPQTDTVSLSSSPPSSSSSWSSAAFTGRAVGDVFGWLHRRWHNMSSSFLQLRPQYRHLLLLLLVVLPLLLLFSLHPAALDSLLPATPADWRTPLNDLNSAHSQSEESAAEETVEVESSKETLHGPPSGGKMASSAVEAALSRLLRLEQTVEALWERVEAGGRRAEQRRQVAADDESWLNVLVEQKVKQLRIVLEEERRRREKVRREQRSHTSRLDQLEQQLQALAADAQEAQQRREADEVVPPPSVMLPAAVSVDRHSHEALQAQVTRLEASLEDIRRDVEGLIQDTTAEQVSAQVQEEVRSLIYGNQPMVGGVASDGVLQWLGRRFISGVDLEASLSSLELKVLQNVSLQMEQLEQQRPLQDTRDAAVSREDVHVMVEEALRLFAQDRTGMADYALESGGGSILSTRCSETYRTEVALLSLFGVPLWYFSQSPRAVIQPDVHPGNCWAFRGSLGFLVIRLSMRILPSSFTLEHIPKSLAPSGSLLSAPRDFSVYGLEDLDQDSGTLLGSYTYDQDGDALQTFSATEPGQQSFQIIEVRVLSNWGHPDYTCMYRFRVHGTPRDP